MAFQEHEKNKTTSSEEVVSPNTPSAMHTSPIDLGHIEVLQILNEHGEVDGGLEEARHLSFSVRLNNGLLL